MPVQLPRWPLYFDKIGMVRNVNIWRNPYTLPWNIKYTAAYTADHTTIANAWFLNLPRLIIIKYGAITAMHDQADGKDIRQIAIIAIIFPHWGTFPLSHITISTTDHANDHITLVWLNIPVESGSMGIPKAKSYAKCDITAKINSRRIYFLTSRVWCYPSAIKNHMIGAVSLPITCRHRTYHAVLNPGNNTHVRWSTVIAIMAIVFIWFEFNPAFFFASNIPFFSIKLGVVVFSVMLLYRKCDFYFTGSISFLSTSHS